MSRLYVDGLRREYSTGCTDEEAAKAVLAEWERQAADPHREAQDHTLNDALYTVLEDHQVRADAGNITTETLKFYKKQAGHLVRVLGHEVRIATIQDAGIPWRYVAARRSEGASDATIKKELMMLISALRRAAGRGLWKGELGAVAPDLSANYTPRERDLSRAEFLALVPHLPPNDAAAAAFALATSAEMAALRAAEEQDLPTSPGSGARVWIRGTKNDRRDRWCPVVTDEQWALLDFAREHASGRGGRLFGALSNFGRELGRASTAARIPHVWPHALRKAAGQWLIDLAIPLELVSKVLGHGDTRTTQRIYARVRDEDLGQRMLAAVDPRYASRTLVATTPEPTIETITRIPRPKQTKALYTVGGVLSLESGSAR